MALLFKTREDVNVEVDILGVGVVPPNARGGIPVERAADTMPELWRRDKSGELILDLNGRGTPLEGKELKEAAEVWAAQRNLQVVDIAQKRADEALAENGGSPLDGALPDVVEASRRAFNLSYGGVIPDEVPGDFDPAPEQALEEAKK